MSQGRTEKSGSTQPTVGSIGTLVGVDSPALTEMISALGFDFLFLDLEHGEIDFRALGQHLVASRVPVLTRLPDGSEGSVKRAVDAGATSIVVPHVGSAELAASVVSWAHYPPLGRRSVGLSRSTLLGYQLGQALDNPAAPGVIVQIEDTDGVTNVEAIVGTSGVTGLFVGPFDLSAALGVPGDFRAQAFHEALQKVIHAGRRAGVPVGVFAPTPARWHEFVELGFDYVVLGADSLFLADGASYALARARGEHVERG